MEDLTLSYVGDAVIELPIEYKINDKIFCLYPPSLGSTLLINRAVEKNKGEKELIAEVLAICSFEKRSDARYVSKLNERAEEIGKAEITKLMPIYSMIAEWNKDQGKFIKHFRLDIEQRYMKRAHDAKDKNSGSLTFNGKSIYGTLIDVVCERYGWTMDYAVWGISLVNLNMLVADKVTSVFLTDKENKRAAIPQDRDILKIDKNTDIKQILAHLKK